MRPEVRCLLIAAVYLFDAAAAHAQRAPTPDDIRARLNSDIPAEIAWAAFDAGTYQISEVVPDLNIVLASPPGRFAAGARALPLTLNVTVNDFRGDRRQPLPDVTSPAR